MKKNHLLYEDIYEELCRVHMMFDSELSRETRISRNEKLREHFSIFTFEEIISFYEILELL